MILAQLVFDWRDALLVVGIVLILYSFLTKSR